MTTLSTAARDAAFRERMKAAEQDFSERLKFLLDGGEAHVGNIEQAFAESVGQIVFDHVNETVSLRQQLEEANGRADTNRAELKRLTDDRNQAEEHVLELTTDRDALKHQLEAAMQERDNYHKKACGIADQRDALRAQLGDMKNELSNALDFLALAETTEKTLRSQLATLEARARTL